MNDETDFQLKFDDVMDLGKYESSLDLEIAAFWGVESLKTSFGFCKK